MVKLDIDTNSLMPYIMGAFYEDNELLNFYDKKRQVHSLMDACNDIHKKLTEEVEGCVLKGIEIDNKKIGYYAFSVDGELLVSFGINKDFRDKNHLSVFWDLIKKDMKPVFSCMLYSYNTRGIIWLERSGMDILFENVTILKFNDN